MMGLFKIPGITHEQFSVVIPENSTIRDIDSLKFFHDSCNGGEFEKKSNHNYQYDYVFECSCGATYGLNKDECIKVVDYIKKFNSCIIRCFCIEDSQNYSELVVGLYVNDTPTIYQINSDDFYELYFHNFEFVAKEDV